MLNRNLTILFNEISVLELFGLHLRALVLYVASNATRRFTVWFHHDSRQKAVHQHSRTLSWIGSCWHAVVSSVQQPTSKNEIAVWLLIFLYAVIKYLAAWAGPEGMKLKGKTYIYV
jgi:hypothetical protein